MVSDMDSILRHLVPKSSSVGRYSVLIFILLCSGNVITVLHHLAMTMYGAPSPHRCALPPGVNPNTSIPGGEDGQCSVYKNYSRSQYNETEACPMGWTYNKSSAQETTIVIDFDLVCDKEFLKNLSTTIYFCGVMIGGLIFGALSDRFGRKPSLLTALFAQAVVGVGVAFANSYLLFTLLRFCLGILMQGVQTCSFVMISELFPTERRASAGTIFEVFWGLGVIWLALLSYLLENWRHIQLAIAAPTVLTLLYIWVLPESLRWLITNHKYTQAEEVTRKIARYNRVPLPDDPLGRKSNAFLIISTSPSDENVVKDGGSSEANVTREELEILQGGDRESSSDGQVRKYTMLDMFRTPRLRERSLLFCYIWFVSACGYYGLSLNLTTLSGNKYFNLFLGGLCELPAYISAIFIVRRFGRSRPLSLYLLIGGITCIIAGVIPSHTSSGTDIRWLSRSLAVLGRFSMAGCFSILFLYTSEVFPTVIRNVSVGTCSFWTRMGGVLAPQVLTLGKVTFTQLPFIIFGCLSLVGAFVSLRLPETKDCSLPDTIEEAENMKPKMRQPVSNQIYLQSEGKLAPVMEKVHIPTCESISKDLSTTGISSMKEAYSCDV
ncbi:hypothetical protein CAPTEDRAFT_220884 [Capitella teleta]|uniref:Major facilitator superfamily (MFS) profile domain-containing protein n=1 Tax=Capitella teleta TaxID=283909 RepID=R7VEZ2_CAPTE|nr:hypothetical protein CAPTEDRAFT_220884 [Capitella teleta]|eukprot:ELU14225.1 hypothetical protein CAPTEDRAFT_220884 [Capitella teleta]